MIPHRMAALRWFVNEFANMNLVGCTDEEWATVRQGLFLHLYPGERLTADHEFHLIDKKGVGVAQADVKSISAGIANENTNRMPDPRTYSSAARGRQAVAQWRRESARRRQLPIHCGNLRLSDQDVRIIRAPDGTLQKRPGLNWNNPDGATLIKARFLDALTEMGTRADQIMRCENRNCGKFFISLKKPRQDRKAHYCSVQCCHRESRRRYLEDPLNKQKERARNRARYKLKKREALGKHVRVGREREPREQSVAKRGRRGGD